MYFASQTDCFAINRKFWKILAIDPFKNFTRLAGIFYYYYSMFFAIFILFLYITLSTINFYFVERKLDSITDDVLVYFTQISVVSTNVTFMVKHKEIVRIFETLDGEVFQPVTTKEFKIIEKATKFNKLYWKIVAAVSLTSDLFHNLLPLIVHLFIPIKLKFPTCSYSFIPEELKERLFYPLYYYQFLGIFCYMWSHVNFHTFFVGLMVLIIAQLDILDEKLRNLTIIGIPRDDFRVPKKKSTVKQENELLHKLNETFIHFHEVYKFCSLVQKTLGVTLFVQFSVAAMVICICLFRFTLPAPVPFQIFLGTYMFVIVTQILVPCWFGTGIMDRSNKLSNALYDCDWTLRPRRFRTNMRLFVERTNKPLSITGLKMFPLSLTTFSSIMHTAYSFFALLRNVQGRL